MPIAVTTKVEALLNDVKGSLRPNDWEQRLRLFAGTDTRIINNIPNIRREEAAKRNLIEALNDYLETTQK